MSIHDGHRRRLKARFIKTGLENFKEDEVLELLLFYCIPRIDTQPLARRLLERFGGLDAVLDTPMEQLLEVEGMGENAAAFLPLVKGSTLYTTYHRKEEGDFLPTAESCGRYMVPFFRGRKNEAVYLLCLDGKCKVLCCKEVGEGSVNSAAVPIRRVVEMALEANATSVVLAHNHPSGLALPSQEDLITTQRLSAALKAVEVTLADHVVVADEDFVSMAQSHLPIWG